MTAAARIIERLQGVRRAGDGRWRARCPGHNSQSQSLAVADRDGRALVHCFAGCEVSAVLGALGLGLGDLYDQPLGDSYQSSPAEWHLRDALAALVVEARIILIAASDIASGRVLSDADVERVARAAGRIASAYRRLYGSA
jgi:hypothetical protein